MPTLTEKLDSRERTTGDTPAVTLHYLLGGVADDLSAKTLLINSTAAEYDGLKRESIQFEPVWVDTAAGDALWDCRVRYVAPENKEPETGESRFSFDTGGGTQHVTQSLQTVSTHDPAGRPASAEPAAPAGRLQRRARRAGHDRARERRGHSGGGFYRPRRRPQVDHAGRAACASSSRRVAEQGYLGHSSASLGLGTTLVFFA